MDVLPAVCVTLDCRYSYYSAEDNALNESPLSLSQEKYNQLLGFSISSALLAFALAIGCAIIYSRARRRFAMVAPAEDDSGRPAPSFWMWLWRDLTRKESVPDDASKEKPTQNLLEMKKDQQSFRRNAKKGYIGQERRAPPTVQSFPPTPQEVASALQDSEYFRSVAQEELERRERVAMMAREEREMLGLRAPALLVAVPLELPPSHRRRLKGAKGSLPPPPTLPRPY
jgi:hypothetical protein